MGKASRADGWAGESWRAVKFNTFAVTAMDAVWIVEDTCYWSRLLDESGHTRLMAFGIIWG